MRNNLNSSGGNLSNLVRRAVERGGDRPALLFRQESISWAELDHDVDAVARGLAGQCAPGDRVAVALGNVPDFARVYLGALRAELVAVPINPSYRAGELAHVLSDSGASILVAGSGVAREVAEVRSQLPELREVYQPGGAPG
ncbi:MAG TPA: AMP-binding protein, partial [Micromonosporaceae bacterium]|nr:AMP-binding protein [Micromonosporaceae bacterium]